MSNTPIAQIAVSTIKGTEKQNIYPKTIDRAVLTTDKEGNKDTLDNVLIKKQDKLVAGDDATRLNGAKLSTKQIFTGSINTIAGAVPTLLPVGGCLYNSADKKLYIGDSNSQPVEVAKPNDFLFFSNGKLYHYQFGNFGEVGTGGTTGTTLVAGDGATRINASALSTKQIYRGTVINTADTVPAALPVGAYCFNKATKKLYVGAQHGNAVVTDTVPMPDDFLFIDTSSGTTYRCDGTTLNNIATNLDLRAGDGMLIEEGTFSSLGVIGGTVYNDKDAAINIPAVGTYAFNAATGKLYTTGVRMVNDTPSRYLKEIVPPKVFFFYDTAEGKLYFWNGAALTQK